MLPRSLRLFTIPAPDTRLTIAVLFIHTLLLLSLAAVVPVRLLRHWMSMSLYLNRAHFENFVPGPCPNSNFQFFQPQILPEHPTYQALQLNVNCPEDYHYV